MRTQMMLVAVLMASSASAADCPRLDGIYGVTQVTDANGSRAVNPTQVKIRVQQNGCATLTITQNRDEDPEQQTVTYVRTDGQPTLYIARPEDSDGPEEYVSFTFKGRKLEGEILYLYEGNSQFVHTGAILTFDLDETNNLRETLTYLNQGVVLSYKTQRQ